MRTLMGPGDCHLFTKTFRAQVVISLCDSPFLCLSQAKHFPQLLLPTLQYWMWKQEMQGYIPFLSERVTFISSLWSEWQLMPGSFLYLFSRFFVDLINNLSVKIRLIASIYPKEKKRSSTQTPRRMFECSQQHVSQEPKSENKPNVRLQTHKTWSIIQWHIIQP